MQTRIHTLHTLIQTHTHIQITYTVYNYKCMQTRKHTLHTLIHTHTHIQTH